MKRRPLGRKASRRSFRRGAKPHPRNAPLLVSRGGIRL